MRPRPVPADLTTRPFRTTEAYAAGLGRGKLRGRAVRRIHTGIYVASQLSLDLRSEVAAARLVLPEPTLVTGVTALWCLGIAIGEPRPLPFITTHPHQVRRPGIQVARTQRLPPRRAGSVSVEHAFVVAGRRLDLVELVAAGDWLVRRKLTTTVRLIGYAGAYRGAGAAQARRAAGLVRERVDSPGETRLRLCLLLAGLPEPQCNITLGTDDRPIGRVDLLLEAYKLILEYEGDHHRTDRWQWNVDIGRVEEFVGEGYRVLRVTSAHVKQPRALVGRVHSALVAGGYSGPAPVLTAEWCALFERTAR